MASRDGGQKSTDNDTRDRVLNAALHVFSERGFDAATLREITEAAGANIAAVNYYFRSKDALIREVLETFTRPGIEGRIAALDACERAAADGRPDLEDVIEALVRPMVQLSHDRRGGRAMIRLLMQTRALPRPQTVSFFSEELDPLVHRFVDALARAAPELGRPAVFWRYNFALGAVMQVLTDSDPKTRRLARLSDGLCDTDDDEAIIAQLVAFISAGFRAPSRTRVRSSAARVRAPA